MKNKRFTWIIIGSIILLILSCLFLFAFMAISLNIDYFTEILAPIFPAIKSEVSPPTIEELPISESTQQIEYDYLFEPFWQSLELLNDEFVSQPIDMTLMALAAQESLENLFVENNIPKPETLDTAQASKLSKEAKTPRNFQDAFSEFWETWLQVINSDIILTYSYNDLMEYALSGMVASLDDKYTEFMTEEEYQILYTQMNGENYEGIGAWVDTSGDYLMIQTPMRDSPAEAVGLKANDLIIAIDGEDMTGVDPESARQKVLGPAGSIVILTIKREGIDPFDVEITRGAIHSPSVYSKTLDENGHIFGYMQIASFGEDTYSLLRLDLEDLLSQNIEGLIIDLRYNGGGYVTTAIEITSEFVTEEIIFYQIDSTGNKFISYNTGKGIAHDIPLVILVNESSASASEIMAGSIKDHERASLVGTTTFGKGLVQTPFVLQNDRGVIKITTAHWYTPEGSLIQDIGIEPDYLVEFSEEDIANNNDAQLNKAIEILLSGD